jgi:hypothetical protein
MGYLSVKSRTEVCSSRPPADIIMWPSTLHINRAATHKCSGGQVLCFQAHAEAQDAVLRVLKTRLMQALKHH